MILFAVFGGLIGLFAGGVAGLIVGVLVGLSVGAFMLRVLVPIGQGGIQAQFLDTTFAVMGALCKADGRVTAEEIRVAEEYFDKLALSGEQRRAAQASFERGKCIGFDLFTEVSKLRSVLRYNNALLQLFLQVQLSAIAADGAVDENEHRLLLHVARALGLSSLDLERLEAMLRNASIGADEPARCDLDSAYTTLGVNPSASNAEVKRAYRRLMSRYHPDKFASQGLSENMRKVAEERALDIRKAYDAIKQRRRSGHQPES